MDITIYHNPKCGTSRNTLALIRNTGVEPQVIEYSAAAPAFPRYELLQFRLIGINEYLRMRQAPADWSESTTRAPLMARA